MSFRAFLELCDFEQLGSIETVFENSSGREHGYHFDMLLTNIKLVFKGWL